MPLGTTATAAYKSFMLPLPLQKIRGEQRAPGSMLAFKSAVLPPHGEGRGILEFSSKGFFKPKPVLILMNKVCHKSLALALPMLQNLYSICKDRTRKVLSRSLKPHPSLSYTSTVLLKSMDFSGLNKA